MACRTTVWQRLRDVSAGYQQVTAGAWNDASIAVRRHIAQNGGNQPAGRMARCTDFGQWRSWPGTRRRSRFRLQAWMLLAALGGHGIHGGVRRRIPSDGLTLIARIESSGALRFRGALLHVSQIGVVFLDQVARSTASMHRLRPGFRTCRPPPLHAPRAGVPRRCRAPRGSRAGPATPQDIPAPRHPPPEAPPARRPVRPPARSRRRPKSIRPSATP
jgi:hypothetical protein